MACKANCAACVSINMPHTINLPTFCSPTDRAQCTDLCNTKFLDASCRCGIIIITIGVPILGDRGARQERQPASQSSSPPRRGHVEPCTRKGPRSEISRQRVLRPARCRAGQVRDAAPRVGRECAGGPCNRGIRGLEADLLSDQGQLRCSRDRWAGAEEAGTPRSAQAPGGSNGICPKPTGRRRAHSSARTSEADPAEIQSQCTPQDNRASGRLKKNSEMRSNSGDDPQSPSSIATQYETLRRAALGEVLPPEARYGLMLFLRRGMWGWARAVTMNNDSASQQPTRSPSLSLTASEGSRVLIHAFAAIAMNIQHQGATT